MEWRRQADYICECVKLTAVVSATDLAATGALQVGVTNPAPGGGQASTTFTVSAPVAPIVSSISPADITVGGSAFSLTVSGHFTPNSVVQWNGSDRSTTYVSNAQLTASVLASDISTAVAALPVTVSTPAPGGGSSNSVPMLVEYPLPSISSLGPSQVALGSGPLALTVSGTNFVTGATIYWNRVSRVTQFVSSTQLTASMLASDISVPAAVTASVTVQNPSPSAGISNVASFAILNPVPVIASISPTTAPAGTRVAISVTGSGFVPGATLQMGSQSFPTSYTSATSVKPRSSLPQLATYPFPSRIPRRVGDRQMPSHSIAQRSVLAVNMSSPQSIRAGASLTLEG